MSGHAIREIEQSAGRDGAQRSEPTDTDLPTSEQLVAARFRRRLNRFVVEADTPDGVVVAHLPNTGRLTHLTVPGRTWILRREHAATRKTAYTATRAWDGVWVALEASRASNLLADWLAAGGSLPGVGTITKIRAEVPVGSQRLDLAGEDESGQSVWIEVKSGGRVRSGEALLSETPSSRGAAHLEALSGLSATGSAAVVAFVFQRPDPARLVVGGQAEAGWITAVRTAAEAGVRIAAFRCLVTAEDIRIDRQIPVAFT